MSSKTYDFSVIVAIYNGVSTVRECLASIVSQENVSVQLIVIDGASTDGTIEVLSEFSNDISHFVSEKDSGIYDAWNKGLKVIDSEWVIFLGCDDYFWRSNVLAEVQPLLYSSSKEIPIIYGSVCVVNSRKDYLYSIGAPWSILKQTFYKMMCLPHPATFHRSTLFKDVGLFDSSFKIAGDYDFLLRALGSKDALYIGGEPIVGMRHGGMSSSPRNALKGLSEIYMARYKNGLKDFSLPLFLFKIRIYLRYFLGLLFSQKFCNIAYDFGRKLRGLPPLWTKV
ncbi:glycosyltransferase family 2 protein [Curvibacter sp. HBC28]|uniref:Glycosyltransferase family 2 protein n=1 Tax=Curvibacter microcysteis TaxID=3026419 RepID=A0ABT5MDC7_9BURK|nr:glycosyltransferase family 2 protein [Curvibacter sp. HBC28]MDD0814588.1 glycosyltransferase family 2 protein [Curvibacter sp. HBC28]